MTRHHTDTLHDLTDDEGWTRALTCDLAVIFKHSTRCWSSQQALQEIEKFARRRPEVPVYVVDVLLDREFARRIGRETGVRHESPQVIVLRAGRAVWHASHGDVTAGAIEAQAAPAKQP